MDTDEPDWPAYLAKADRLVVAARSLARWTTNNDAALRDFFSRDGAIEVFSHDPQADANMELVAASHSGYGTGGEARVRSNVVTGLERLVLASDGAARIWYVAEPQFIFTLSLFAFYRNDELVRVVLRPQENVRAGVTSAPVFVLRADADDAVRSFVDREILGLRRVAAELSRERVRALRRA